MGRKKPHKMTTDELRREAVKLQKKGIVSRLKKAARNIPETSTRFQLQVDIAARKLAAKEAKKVRKKGRKSLMNLISDLRKQ